MLEMLEEYEMLGAKPSSIPMEVNVKLVHTEDNLLNDPGIYGQIVRKLMYVTLTRPDITYSVHVLSQFMDKPTQIHIEAAYKELKYLKGTLGQGLFMSANSNMKITAYSDSDWADCQETRR